MGRKRLAVRDQQELMVGKRTVSRGAFHKDVIAGHISTAKISGNRTYDGIWHDGQSHYYLDGTTWRSGKIPVLEYDSETENTEKYSEKYCNAAQQNHGRAEKVIEPNQARSEAACGYPL